MSLWNNIKEDGLTIAIIVLGFCLFMFGIFSLILNPLAIQNIQNIMHVNILQLNFGHLLSLVTINAVMISVWSNK